MSLLDRVFDKMTLPRIRTMQHNPHGLEIFSKHRHIHQGIVDRQPQVATQAIQSHLMASKERVIREIQTLQITALLNPITNCPPHEVGQALDNPAPAGRKSEKSCSLSCELLCIRKSLSPRFSRLQPLNPPKLGDVDPEQWLER